MELRHLIVELAAEYLKGRNRFLLKSTPVCRVVPTMVGMNPHTEIHNPHDGDYSDTKKIVSLFVVYRSRGEQSRDDY